MNRLLLFLLIVFVFTHCSDDTKPACSTKAIIRDLTGLDGCGYVLELEDGTRLEPVLPSLFCGTPPLPKEITEDPLYNFEFVDGKRVVISYQEAGSMSICMAGTTVKITCIQEDPAFSPHEK
jgi:hypothetical protein